MKQTRTYRFEFWSPLFAHNAGDIVLTFILLTLETLTKLKTTFGRHFLYWMLSFFHERCIICLGVISAVGENHVKIM
jgi:hypothetical protein